MRLLPLSLLAAAAQVVSGLSDTSPLFLFSTSELLFSSKPSLQSAAAVTASLEATLESCPSHFYILASQPGVTATDFASNRAAPSLSRMISGDDKVVRSSASIPDVVGSINQESLVRTLQSKCGTDVVDIDIKSGRFTLVPNGSPRVLNIDFPAPASSKRADTLLGNDALLATYIENLPSQNYTVIIFTSPTSTSPTLEEQIFYEMDESSVQEPLHQDLKRDNGDISRRQETYENYTLPEGDLFERYQYFTPGLFMGFLIGLPLLLILYVAISALASLEVSYAAFDKETGPGSQQVKKQ